MPSEIRDIGLPGLPEVSRAEGRLVRLDEITPSPLARRWGAKDGREPRLIAVVLSEAVRVVRMDRGVLIAERRRISGGRRLRPGADPRAGAGSVQMKPSIIRPQLPAWRLTAES